MEISHLSCKANQEVGQGSINFFYENQTGKGYLVGKLGIDLSEITLREVADNDFNFLRLLDEAKESLQAKFLKVYLDTPHRHQNMATWQLWVLHYQLYNKLINPKSHKVPLLRNTWAPHIATKISFFSQRIFHNMLATYDNLKIPIASKCCCCERGHLETTEHLLLQSDLANPIQKYYNDIFSMRRLRFYPTKIILQFQGLVGNRNSVESFATQ